MALHILLADDSVPAQNMGKKILTDAGFEVTTASNGLEAIRKIADTVPDVAVLDIFMPGYSGLEVCQKLRASAATATLPVVLTVGKLEPYRPEDGARVQSTAVIVKPFIAADLVKVVLDVATQAGKTGVHEPAPAAPAEPAETDEPIFSYAPTIPDRDADFPMGEGSAYGTTQSADSADNMLFNPEAKHIPFSASATDFIPSISMGETHGVTVESVIADVNLEPEGKDREELTLHHVPLDLPPEGLLPEIEPPPLDIPTLDPLLDIGIQPMREGILGDSKIQVGELPEQYVVRPEPPAEVLTPEEEARRRAFEDLFNSAELPPLEEPVAKSATLPAGGEAPPDDSQFEATKFAVEKEFTAWTASAPVSEETPSAPEALSVAAFEIPLESPKANPVAPVEEAPAEPASHEEAAAAWNTTPAPAEFGAAHQPAEALPAWGAAEAEEKIAGSFPLNEPQVEHSDEATLNAAPEVEIEPVAEAAAPETGHFVLELQHLDLQSLDLGHGEQATAAETAIPAPEAPRVESWSAPEPEPVEEHHSVIEGLAGVAAGAGVAASIPAAAALVEEQLKNVIAALHPAETAAVEHVAEPPATVSKTAVTETAVTEVAAAEEAAPLEIATTEAAAEPEPVELEVAPIEASPAVIAANESARPEAEVKPAAEAVATKAVAASAAPVEDVHEEAAHKEDLPIEVPAEPVVAVPAVAAAATAADIAHVAVPDVAEHVAGKAEEVAAAAAEEVRSPEAERMHQAVERVFDRFKPLLIAAIVRELARTNTE